jgi:hypothetical protein
MDKWEELKLLIDGHMSWPVIYSHSREFEKGEMKRVKEWMKYLEDKEKDRGFLFTEVPNFDQKTWEKILEEKGLQGLS